MASGTAFWVLLASLTLFSVLCAQWLAHRRGRPVLRWMVAAALLGPLPLVPLVLLPRRIFRHR
jgi:hypothetical protein